MPLNPPLPPSWQIPEWWRWWRDPATGSRLVQEYASNGSPKTTLVAFAYDPTDDALRFGGDFGDAEERGAAKCYRFKPVPAMASTYHLQIQNFEDALPPDNWV